MKKALAIALIISSLAFLYSCKGLIKNRQTTLVTVTVGNSTVSLDVRPATLPVLAKRYLSRAFSLPAAQAAVPANVRDLRLTISAADMTAIIQTVFVAGLDTVDFLVDVPNGLQRNFLVEGLDANGVVQYTGAAVSDLNGSPVLLTITMAPTGADAIAPTFLGVTAISNTTISSMTLSWDPATDNITTTANIVYLIYRSTTAGVFDFTTPTYITSAGATGYTATGLSTGTTYYFVVRARDEAGNIDTGTVQLSATYPSRFVNVATGSDIPAAGTQALPYRTVTFALTQTSGNEALVVSAGTYSALNESFPLQLKTGTALACIGAGHSTIFTAPSTTVLSGAAGAIIDGCTVIVPPITIAIPAITDNGVSTTVNDCVIDGNGADTVLGIHLSADSTVRNSTLTRVAFQALGDAIVVAAGSPLITNNTITANTNGVSVTGGSPAITGNSFGLHVGLGTGAGVIISSSTGTATVSGNTFSQNVFGVSVSAGNALIGNNTIQTSTDSGVRITGGAPIIELNTIIGSSINGINVSGGSATIRDNQINTNGTGISISNVGASVTGNTINNNTSNGIIVSGSTANPVINNNSLYCNAGADLFLSGTITAINATNNSWDHAGPTLEIATCGTSGIDICNGGTAPTSSPFNAAVPTGCP